MTVLILLGSAVVLHLIAGRFYARYVSRKLGEDHSRVTPAVEINDGHDYVPTSTHVVFGHHFASIAGAGPIIGPLIGLIYGWGPAWLWVVFGAIFLGAVHDYTALYVSMRAGGRSLAEVARQLMGKWAYALMIAFIIIMLVLVTAVFLNLSAKALSAKLPRDILELEEDDTTFRVVVDDGVEKLLVGGKSLKGLDGDGFVHQSTPAVEFTGPYAHTSNCARQAAVSADDFKGFIPAA